MKPITEHERHLGRVILEGTGCWGRILTDRQVKLASKEVQQAYEELAKGPRMGSVLQRLRKDAKVAPLRHRAGPSAPSAESKNGLNFCTSCGADIRKRSAAWKFCGLCGAKL